MIIRHQAGATLVETIGAIAVATAAFVGLTFWVNMSIDDMKGQEAARFQNEIANGLKNYIKHPTWNAFIKANATTAVPVKVVFSTLAAGNFIKPGMSSANAFRQTPCGLIYYNSTTDRIDAMITTEGGVAIPDKLLGYVASAAGDNAGMITTAAPTVVKGAYGSWSFPLATYTDGSAAKNCSGTPASAGHLASITYMEASGTYDSGPLYRDQMPGRPDLNTMNTPIVMSASTVQTPSTACSPNGSIGRTAAGKVLACVSGLWKEQGSAYWEDPVATFAALPACNAAIQWQTRIVSTPTVGTKPRAHTCNGAGVWLALGLDNNGNLALEGSTIYAAGSNATNGALTVQGAKNGYAGIAFRDGSRALQDTLMTNATRSGFYNAADNAWRYYVDNSGNSYQPGTVTPGLVVAENSSCASYNVGAIAQSSTTAGGILSCQGGVWKNATGGAKTSGGAYTVYTFSGGCNTANPETGACSCLPGEVGYITGFGWSWSQWDLRYHVCTKFN